MIRDPFRGGRQRQGLFRFRRIIFLNADLGGSFRQRAGFVKNQRIRAGEGVNAVAAL